MPTMSPQSAEHPAGCGVACLLAPGGLGVFDSGFEEQDANFTAVSTSFGPCELVFKCRLLEEDLSQKIGSGSRGCLFTHALQPAYPFQMRRLQHGVAQALLLLPIRGPYHFILGRCGLPTC